MDLAVGQIPCFTERISCLNKTCYGQLFSTWRLHVAWMCIWWVCTQAAPKENPNPNPSSQDHCCTEWVEMSYVCAYSSVQLDKRRVEKQFTTCSMVWLALNYMPLVARRRDRDRDDDDYDRRRRRRDDDDDDGRDRRRMIVIVWFLLFF